MVQSPFRQEDRTHAIHNLLIENRHLYDSRTVPVNLNGRPHHPKRSTHVHPDLNWFLMTCSAAN